MLTRHPIFMTETLAAHLLRDGRRVFVDWWTSTIWDTLEEVYAARRQDWIAMCWYEWGDYVDDERDPWRWEDRWTPVPPLPPPRRQLSPDWDRPLPPSIERAARQWRPPSDDWWELARD